MQLWLRWVCGVGLLLASFFGAAAPDDFQEAKRIAQRIYSDENQTFYCGCPLRWQGGKGIPDLKTCGYQVRKNGPRAQRIEWEHVVPAHQFGHQRQCWRQGGRERCGESDAGFRAMEADLFNLKPAIGEVNGDRANFQFGHLPARPAQYGNCAIQIDFQQKIVEPRPEIRGDIARIYFYMADKYALQLSQAQQKLFLDWHQQDPVDARERQVHQRIAQHMGQANLFVTGEREWYLGYIPTGYGMRGAQHLTLPEQKPDQKPALKPKPANEVVANPDVSKQVVGNRNSQLYHLAHCPGFSQVSAKNQRWFATEQQAITAGFRRAKNCP